MVDQRMVDRVVDFLRKQGVTSWDEISSGDQGLWIGVIVGWWDWVDWNKKIPIPFPKIVNIHGKDQGFTMAHALFEAGLYESVSRAKKDGWNRPALCGDYFPVKKIYRLKIIDD